MATKLFSGCKEIGPLEHCWRGCEMVKSLWKIIWWFHKILNIELQNDSAITLLVMYPNVLKSGTPIDICTQIQHYSQ